MIQLIQLIYNSTKQLSNFYFLPFFESFEESILFCILMIMPDVKSGIRHKSEWRNCRLFRCGRVVHQVIFIFESLVVIPFVSYIKKKMRLDEMI